MKTHFKQIFTLIFFTVLFYSCQKTIDFDGDKLEPKVVVNALLIANTKITTSISKSQSLLSDKDFFEPLTNAKADLYINDVFAETLKFESNPDTLIKQLNYGVTKEIPYDKGVYISETTVEAGKTYRLEVRCNGMNDVSCETTVPFPVEIINIDTFTEVIAISHYI